MRLILRLTPGGYGERPCLKHYNLRLLVTSMPSLYSVSIIDSVMIHVAHVKPAKAFEKWSQAYKTKIALKAVA